MSMLILPHVSSALGIHRSNMRSIEPPRIPIRVCHRAHHVPSYANYGPHRPRIVQLAHHLRVVAPIDGPLGLSCGRGSAVIVESLLMRPDRIHGDVVKPPACTLNFGGVEILPSCAHRPLIVAVAVGKAVSTDTRIMWGWTKSGLVMDGAGGDVATLRVVLLERKHTLLTIIHVCLEKKRWLKKGGVLVTRFL